MKLDRCSSYLTVLFKIQRKCKLKSMYFEGFQKEYLYGMRPSLNLFFDKFQLAFLTDSAVIVFGVELFLINGF